MDRGTVDVLIVICVICRLEVVIVSARFLSA